MSFSPQDPNAGYLLTTLHELEKQGRAADGIAPGTEDEARSFLLALDEDPAVTPRTPVERGAALILRWSLASTGGDSEQAAAIVRQIEQEAQGNPFPFRRTIQAHVDSDFVNALTSPTSSYRSYGADLSYGVIQGKLADDAKIGILGDWGTGEEDAAYLLDCMLEQHGDLAAILHLGDVYDSGTKLEQSEKFLKPLQAAFSRHKVQIPVFAVPGDHEYFTHGAAGFFWMIQQINAWDPQWTQEASYFCLRTRSGSWQILGADTGYAKPAVQPGLREDEKKWHQDKVSNFSGKTLFLTHRQFVSAYDRLNGSFFNDALVRDMKDLMPKIDVLLWGHEHRFVPFMDRLAIPTYSGNLKATLRTFGGSARHTSEQSPANASIVLPTKNPDYSWTGFANGLCNHTFAILDLGAEAVSYYQAPAWRPTTRNPVRSVPKQPVLVDQL